MGKTTKEILVESQGPVQNHGKLVKAMNNVYKATQFDEFWADFIPLLKTALMVFEREPAVERFLEFVAKFATSLKNDDDDHAKDDDTNGNEMLQSKADDDIHQFLLKLFDFCLQHNNASNKAVRFRVCQLVNKLLSKMGEDAQIDDELYDRIYECMLQRLRDLFPIVRIQAVFALARLQDPTDEDCPIINGYLFLMSCDTNFDVRRAVLTCIAASTKTLPTLLERTRDVKPVVRRLAYQVLAEKVHIRALTIAQRITVLENGLNDRDESVRESCTTRLLQAWLRTFQGNTLDLLKCLDVESCIQTTQLVLTALFKKTPAHEVVTNFDLLDDKLVMPVENLSCESVLYWRVLCEHLSKLSSEGELLLEKILPLPTAFGAYLNQVVESMKCEDDLEEQLTNEFILHQLLEMIAVLDLSDEAGRRVIGSLLHDLMVSDLTTHSVMATLVERYQQYQRDPVVRINVFCEIIADIREPITHMEDPLGTDEKRQLEMKMAKVLVKLLQRKEELSDSVTKQDFVRAAAVKAEVEQLEAEKRQHAEQLEQPQTQEVRMERSDSATLLKCMSIAAAMLATVHFRSIPASLQTLIETLLLPGVQNDDPAVRNMAVRALGLCCLMKLDIAKKYLVLFITISQLDVDVVKVTSLKVIFDLLLAFGLDTLGVSGTSTAEAGEGVDSDQEENEGMDDTSSTKSKENTSQSLLFILTELLNSEVSELRTTAAEGLAKLLLAGRIIAPKLISRLLLLWYNPLTEDDTLLRHCLGTFFPVYAFASIANQELVVEAILPTLRTLVNAPASSPLVEIDINNVVDLLTQLTNANHLYTTKTADLESTCHDALAVKLCNEILSELQKDDSCSIRPLCRALGALELTPAFSGLRDLAGLADGILETLKDKVSRKTVQRFGVTVKRLLGETVVTGDSQEADGEEDETRSTDEKVVDDMDTVVRRDADSSAPSIQSRSPAGETSNRTPARATRSKHSPVPSTSERNPAVAKKSPTHISVDTESEEWPTSTESLSKTSCSVPSGAVSASGDREVITTTVSTPSTSRTTLGPLEHNQTHAQSPKAVPDTEETVALTKEISKTTKSSKTMKPPKRTTKERQKILAQPDISSSEPENDVHTSTTPVRRSTRACRGRTNLSDSSVVHSETESPLRKATRASSRRGVQTKKTKRT